MSIKISLIVPVYKAEHYLRRCVDSLLAQTFSDYEILLVDDGSPDASGTMCDEYARQDSRIRSYHKENGGVSSARQFGIEHARGEYIIHADPDDWVEPNMLAELYAKAKETDADMVICDFYKNRNSRKTVYVNQQPSILNPVAVCIEMFVRLHGSCCNKLVKRVCFERFGIKFPLELSYSEDLFINVCLLSHQIKVAYLSKAFYHYDLYTNANSLVKKPNHFILNQEEKLCDLLKNALPKTLFNEILPYLLRNQAEVIIYNPEFSLRTFHSDFHYLKGRLKDIETSNERKFYLWLAFYISPYIARYLFRLRNNLSMVKNFILGFDH